MNTMIPVLFAPLVLLLVSACGSVADEPNPSTGKTTVKAFEVTGSVAELDHGRVVIDANRNQGRFRIHWKVATSDPYPMSLWLSHDENLNMAGDLRIYQHNCGSLSLYSCGHDVDLDCRFTTENMLSCGEPSLANPDRNLTTYLVSLPAEKNLIFNVCNALVTDCKQVVVPVVFR